MANLSQMRRQRMLAFLSKMREQHKDDDEVLVAINEVENEITEKKYGLVWEEHSEEVEERMVEEVPVFVEDKDKEITLTEDGYNFLLEGDNLHSLHLLEKTHKEKIDVIYIDPPYNTGNEFIYDDEIVDSTDGYKHSKWLSFMYRRLSIARSLLSPDGVCFISIDDHEQEKLKMLCDDLFGEDNIEQYIWCLQDKTEGSFVKTAGLTVRKEHEYIIACFKNEGKRFRKYKDEAGSNGTFSNPDNDPRGDWFSGNISRNGIKTTTGSKYYSITNPAGITFTRNWTLSKEEYEDALKDGRIFFSKGGAGVPRLKIYKDAERYSIQSSLLNDVHTSITGKNELKAIFGDPPFPFPKPTTLIRRLIEISGEKDSIILDFFAGSGTTGQAVLELNKEDGGNRKFILCTNNENNICEGVTYPRLQTVITGIRQDGNKYSDGIPANLKYYKTDYIPKKSDNLSADLIKHIDEMIQLEYHVKIDKDKYISILTDEDADELEKNWQNFPNIRAIYISRSVLLTGKQRELFETKDCFVIPDYYFREELRDAGEA